MASNEQPAREGTAERVIRRLRNVHIAIGAVALAGAVAFPGIEIFPVIAGYEGVNTLAHEGLRRAVRKRPNHTLQSA